MDEESFLSVCRARRLEAGQNAFLGQDVHAAEDAPQILGDGLAGLRVDVEDGDLRARQGQSDGRGAAQARGAAGDDRGDGIVDAHGFSSTSCSQSFDGMHRSRVPVFSYAGGLLAAQ